MSPLCISTSALAMGEAQPKTAEFPHRFMLPLLERLKQPANDRRINPHAPLS